MYYINGITVESFNLGMGTSADFFDCVVKEKVEGLGTIEFSYKDKTMNITMGTYTVTHISELDDGRSRVYAECRRSHLAEI